jgi:hypothetical protein
MSGSTRTSRLRGRTSLPRFAVAVALGFAAGTIITILLLRPPQSLPGLAARTLGADRAAFTMVLAGSLVPVPVSADGTGCDALQPSDRLHAACRLATITSPPQIGAAAFGRLNLGDEPAYDALVWRAVLSSDASVCSDGGLIGDHLAGCEAAVARGSVTSVDGAVSVLIRSSSTPDASG